MTARLQNKVAIVTGAASGMGAAAAQLFAKNGAKVVVVDLPGAENEDAVLKMDGGKGNMIFVSGDVSSRSDTENFVKTTVGTFGRVDVIFNNAGYYLKKKIEETTDDEYDRLLDVNLRALYLSSSLVIPIMKKQGSGVILSTSSNAGLVGRPNGPIYGAAKGAVISLTKALAIANGPFGIRVNCICPGTMFTPMFESGLAAASDPADTIKRVSDTVALRRLGTAEDVGQAALFLASDEASYITGVALPVDGGRVAGVQEPQPPAIGIR